MTMPRVDLFAVIHKMLRVSIFDTAALIARADFANPKERQQVVDKFAETFAFLQEHHQHEDAYVMSVVENIAPELAQRIAADHVSMDQSLRAVDALVTELETADSATTLGVGAELHLAFSVFIGRYLSHMASEEVEVNAALWAHLTDDELAVIRAELQGSIPPERFAEWFAFMVPAMNVHERIGVLSGIKMNAPTAAFEALGGVARSALGEAGWNEVESSLPG